MFFGGSEERDRFGHRQFQYIVNGPAPHLDIEHVRLVPFPVTLTAADVLITEKLHLDLLVTKSGATFAATCAGVERERSGSQTRSL